MGRRHPNIAIATLASIIVSAAFTTTTVGQADVEAGPARAAIHEGACGSGGQIVEPLQLAVAPGPSAQGISVTDMSTTIALALEELVEVERSIQVRADDAPDASVIACGDIGAAVPDAAALPVALGYVDGSGVAGLALLEAADANGTSVTLYLIDEPASDEEGSASSGNTLMPDEVLHFAGLDITVEKASFDPEAGTITIEAVYANPASGPTGTSALQLNGQPSLVVGDDAIPLRFVEQVQIPARASARADLQATGFPPETSLADTTLIFGRPDQHQATLQLADGAVGNSQSDTSVKIPRKQRKTVLKGYANLTVEDASLLAAGCSGRLDALVLGPAPADEMAMVVTVTATGKAPVGGILQAFLRAPDGTSSVVANGVTALLRGETLRDLSMCFVVPAPGPGKYQLRFEGGDRVGRVKLVAPELSTAPTTDSGSSQD